MTTLARCLFHAPLAVILTAAVAVPQTTDKQVPFHGTFQGTDQDTGFTDTTVSVETKGTGVASHIGEFTFIQENTVNFLDGTDSGTAEWVAANGDTLSLTFSGSGQEISPDLITISETYTITGGTGRFAGAQGTFLVTRIASGTTFLTSGSFVGSISTVGSSK